MYEDYNKTMVAYEKLIKHYLNWSSNPVLILDAVTSIDKLVMEYLTKKEQKMKVVDFTTNSISSEPEDITFRFPAENKIVLTAIQISVIKDVYVRIGKLQAIKTVRAFVKYETGVLGGLSIGLKHAKDIVEWLTSQYGWNKAVFDFFEGNAAKAAKLADEQVKYNHFVPPENSRL